MRSYGAGVHTVYPCMRTGVYIASIIPSHVGGSPLQVFLFIQILSLAPTILYPWLQVYSTVELKEVLLNDTIPFSMNPGSPQSIPERIIQNSCYYTCTLYFACPPHESVSIEHTHVVKYEAVMYMGQTIVQRSMIK